MKNIIFHIDVNSAFLSWEAVYRLFHKGGTLDLREIPSAVGEDISLRHGIILAELWFLLARIFIMGSWR